MTGRRTRPLAALFALSALVVLARLGWVQIREESFWTVEAARLVHSGREIPYRRGRILDTEGRVLARDKDGLELVLVYRDFRRQHPLGLVTHARSLLEDRPVPIPEALAQQLGWTRELVELTPVALQAFAEGEALRTATLEVARVPDPQTDRRGPRAGDLSFYVKRLLPLGNRQTRILEKRAKRAAKEGTEHTFLELAAEVLGTDPALVWKAIERRVDRTNEQLARLARLLPAEEPDGPAHDPLTSLVNELEGARAWVEDATAAKLFVEACGFAPGRIAPDTLLATVDLGWITRELGWDGERLADWAARTREGWREEWRDGYALPRLHLQFLRLPSDVSLPEALLQRASAVFQPEGAVERVLDGDGSAWREVDELAVFGELDDLFEPTEGGEPDADGEPVLPIQDPRLREAYLDTVSGWALYDAAWSAPPAEDHTSRAVAGYLDRRLSADRDAVYGALLALVEDWDRSFQAALRERLHGLLGADGRAGSSPEGLLVVARERRARAAERAEFFLKDYGLRPRRMTRGRPTYDVVYLLTRYEEDYPGFLVRETREREYPVLPGDVAPAAAELVGGVSSVGVEDLLPQRDALRNLRRLQDLPTRDEEEERELRRLVGEVLLHDEVKGVSGVEGFWNAELVGRNGYRESHGLEDVFGQGRTRVEVREAEDGKDVVLTLDTDLQRAARRTLQHPVGVSEDDLFDWAWHRAPVGAIVLVDGTGDVLAAVSEPNGSSLVETDARGQRAVLRERTLQKPTFQPPGSVMKMFFAAYALDRIGLDPRTIVDCDVIERSGCGYKDVRCHKRFGHGEVALHDALVGSCNAYFAWLGETLTERDLRRAGEMFGFGHPTGVRSLPPWDPGLRRRVGLREDVAGYAGGSFSEFDRRLAGNGLGKVEATPMQLARATLALATGELSDLRLVREIGGREVPRRPPRSLSLGRGALELVREALEDVVTAPAGTGHLALGPAEIGFPLAAKTGSADLVSRDDEEGRRIVRKHTWVAGWLPPRDPVLTFVVFVHDTRATSSHGAVYLVRQLLQQPEILTWLAEEGVDVSEVVAR